MTQPAAGPEVDRRWLLEAIRLSRRCPPSRAAYSVGAVLVAADGTVLAEGYSRQTGPADHAEEVTLGKLSRSANRAAGLAAATLYSSLEPCAVRVSRPVACADLIIASGIGRVVFAWREPPVLAPGGGAGRLRSAGVSVVEVPELAAAAREVNALLLARPDMVSLGDIADAAGLQRRAGTGRSDDPPKPPRW